MAHTPEGRPDLRQPNYCDSHNQDQDTNYNRSIYTVIYTRTHVH